MSIAERWNRFWFEHPVLRVRLTTFRVAFFGLLAFDMWMLMVKHAPRYGVARFNVSHLPFLDGVLPLPTPGIATAAFLVGGFLALRVAMGIVTRGSLYALTAIYGGIYFWSQADSYQHHYLIALVLLLCCFLPLEALAEVDDPRTALDAEGAPKDKISSWAARLIYVEVSIVYFYTAVTKTTTYWLDGWALNRIIQTESMRGFLAQWAETFGTSEMGPYAFTAHVIMIWQYFVALAFLFPKLRPLACLTGPAFHILVEVIDLKIGWFSYYMIALYYILLFPDRWFMAVGRPVGRALRRLRPVWEWLVTPRPTDTRTAGAWAVGAGAITAALVMLTVPVAGRGVVAVALGGVVGWSLRPRGDARPIRVHARAGLQLAGVVAMVLSLRGTDALYDYHRYWAGDLKRRGLLAESVEHYAVANTLKSEGPARFFHAGELYERLGRYDEAREAYQRGLERAPGHPRGRRGLARLARVDARASSR